MVMKICQLCAVDFTVEKLLLPLIDAMENENWSVTIICSNGVAVQKLKKNGYRFITLPISRSYNPFRALYSIIGLIKIFKKERFDVIHVHTPIASIIARIASIFVKKTFLVYTAHGFYFHENMPRYKKYFFILIEKYLSRFTDLLFCQSNEDVLEAIKRNIISSKKVYAIGNGVDINKFNIQLFEKNVTNNRRIIGIPKNAIVVGIVARLVEEKGINELLLASINLSQKYSNFYLLLIGGQLLDEHGKSVQKNLILARKKMKSQIIELGFRNDTNMLMSIIDIFCLPSYREGMPRTIIEAMMMGKPVVATNIRGSREEVEDGITGYLVPPKNIFALENMLENLYLDEKKRKIMGQEGRKKALIKFDESNIIRLQIYLIKKYLK
jgi:glycosyltransferase involved in cell wall biosynthesis